MATMRSERACGSGADMYLDAAARTI